MGTSVPWLIFDISSIIRGRTAVLVRAFGKASLEGTFWQTPEGDGGVSPGKRTAGVEIPGALREQQGGHRAETEDWRGQGVPDSAGSGRAL